MYDGRRPTVVKLKVRNGNRLRTDIDFGGSDSWC